MQTPCIVVGGQQTWGFDRFSHQTVKHEGAMSQTLGGLGHFPGMIPID